VSCDAPLRSYGQSPAEIWRQSCSEGKLVYQTDAAGNAIFPLRLGTPDEALRLHESRGLGRVYSTTVTYRKNEPPQNVALIDLDEGFRMLSSVRGLEPLEVAIGLRVRATFVSGQLGDENLVYPIFEPVEGQ